MKQINFFCNFLFICSLQIFCSLSLQTLPNSTLSNNTNESYLWKKLVSMPTETFEKAFLPDYVDFENILSFKTNFTTNFTVSNDFISKACLDSLQVALTAFHERQTWAVKMFSSWGRFPSAGLLSGTLTELGEYDQCLSANKYHPKNPNLNLQNLRSNFINLTPQYCLLDVALPMPPMPKHHNYFQPVKGVLPSDNSKNDTLPVDFRLKNNQNLQAKNKTTIYQTLHQSASVFYYAYLKVGICLPSLCSKDDIHLVAEKKINSIGLKFKKVTCEIQTKTEKWNLNAFQTFALLVLCFLLIITLIAALFTQTKWKNSSRLAFLHWFSPLDNLQKLFDTKNSSSNENEKLSAIHGLRAITLLWIVTAHTLEWTTLNIYRDTFIIKDSLSVFKLQILYKAFYAVETFFYLSGFLTSIVTLKFTAGRYQNFHYLEFLTLRWLRLTPQLSLFLLFTVGLVPPSFNGPLWKEYMRPLVENCGKNWWLNLLYLQNIVNIESICCVHTWFLAADMQLHYLSLVPIVLLLINRKIGQIFTAILASICALISGLQVYINKHPPGHIITSKNDFLNEEGMPSNFVAFLYQPWNHGSVFFIGLLFGVYFSKTFLQANERKENVKLKSTTKYFLWIAGSAVYLFCLYSTYPYVVGVPYDESGLTSAFLFPLNRILWALALSIAIWLCATGNGGYLHSLLSLPALKPLSRISYALYLTHAWVVYVALGTRRTLIDLIDGWSLAFHVTSVVSVSIVIGIVFNVLVETPLLNALQQYKKRREEEIKKQDNREINLYDKVESKELKVVFVSTATTTLIE